MQERRRTIGEVEGVGKGKVEEAFECLVGQDEHAEGRESNVNRLGRV